MRRKITTIEVEFLHRILNHMIEKQGVCILKEAGAVCPHWDEEKNTCTAKSNEQLCRKLQLPLVDDQHVIEIREKKIKDVLEEIQQEINLQKDNIHILNLNIKDLTNQKNQTQQALESLETKKNRVIKSMENLDDDEDSESS